MFKLLMSLFIIFNIVAMVIVLLTIVCAYIGNIRKSMFAKAEVVLPTFYHCKKTYIQCCISSSLFALTAWLLYSPQAVTETGNMIESLAKCIFAFGVIWSVILIIAIISEIVFEFIKNKSLTLKPSLLPIFIKSLWCFILAFIIV